nr:reverse transcriptase domain-containing protein [Tanacetum cinerariifolium]
MTAILKQFQATPPPASVKAIKEICVTCGGAHPYYQCLAADGNTFLEFRDNIQGYVLAAAINYNQGNSGYHPSSVANQIRPPCFSQPNVKNNQNRPFHLWEQTWELLLEDILCKKRKLFKYKGLKTKRKRPLSLTGGLAALTGVDRHLPVLTWVPRHWRLSNWMLARGGGLAANDYVLGNYNQGNPGYRPQGVANLMRPPGFAQPNILKAMQKQIDMVKNELRNEMKTSIQTSLSNQTNEIKNMMASLLQMNTTSTSGSGTLPGNTIANPKGKLKAITTRSGLVTDGPTVPNPPKSVNLEENECVEETSELSKLTNAVNQQTSAVTTAMTAMLNNSNQTHLQPRLRLLRKSVLPVEVFIRTTSVLPPVATLSQNSRITSKNFHLNELEKIKRMNDVSLKVMQNQIDMVKNELKNEMKTSIQTSLSNQTNKIKNMMASLLQMNTASTSGSGTLPSNTIANPKGELKAITTRSGLVTKGLTVPNPPKSVNPEEDECVEEMYTDPDHAEYTIKVPPPPPVQKPKPPIQINFFCILGTLFHRISKKLRDPEKFLIPCGFSELKCKALADLGASINLMPLSVWKKLGLPDLIPTRMTLELANRAIYTPDGIARDFFVPVGKFTFLADFVVVDYESDPRVPFILGRPFLRTAHALIDVHGEEMILRDGDEDCLEDLVSNKQSGNPTFSLHKDIASPEVIHEINDSKGCNFLSEELPDIDSFNDIHSHFDDDPLSGSTTYSANSLFEEFADELALISYPPDYDDNRAYDIEFDVYPDDFLEIESDATFDDDSFDSKGEKIKEAELLIDKLDLPCDILSEYDSCNSQDFSRDDVLPYPDNEDKVFNPGILNHEKSVKIITRVTQEKKLAVTYASWLFEDFDPPFYELFVFKEVPNSMRLLPFSSENEEKVFKPGIYISKKFHCCFLFELSHPGFPIFKVNLIFLSPMKIFHVQNRKNTPLLDVLLFYFYPP